MHENTRTVSRRTVLAGLGVAAGTALAGCSGGGGGNSGDGGDDGGGNGGNVVEVAPSGGFKFKPETITVSTGDTVTWEFKNPTHNVCAWPDMHDKVSIPEGASGFGTMDQGGDAYATVSKGETFEHTFETAGEYNYVCVPHAASGMVGTVVVEE